jgi:hypothetical protein
MKKLLILMVGMFALSFTSCGNKVNSNVNSKDSVDTTSVDTVSVDTTDTVNA